MQDFILFAHKHWFLLLSTAIILVILVVIELIKQKRGHSHLSPSLVTQQINHDNAVILDIRPTETYAAGHIIDAVSIPSAELSTKLKKLEKFKSRPIVVVCANGNEASQSATLLKNAGFIVYILAGGMKSWRDAEMPIVKGSE